MRTGNSIQIEEFGTSFAVIAAGQVESVIEALQS